jgi:hypothetical protein
MDAEKPKRPRASRKRAARPETEARVAPPSALEPVAEAAPTDDRDPCRGLFRRHRPA